MKHALFAFDAFGPYIFLDGGEWTDDELREVGEVPLSNKEKEKEESNG